MRVGILGGGLQGCCVALALAERGIDVTLFDRNDRLLSRAAVANEGKIHLGYMYANDPGCSTARVMMQGALAFAPFFSRHLGLPKDAMTVSRPATYVVHRDSQRSPDQVSQYIASVHALIREASTAQPDAYFGRDLSDQPRMWSTAQRQAEFNPEVALAAFRFMTELALLGEFKFVAGPTYYKRMHGANLHLKRQNWSEHRKQLAWASLAAWIVEALVPAGQSIEDSRRLFDAVLARFLIANGSWSWLRNAGRRLAWSRSRALHPARVVLDRLRSNEQAVQSLRGRWMFYEAESSDQRAALLRMIFERLRCGGRFDPPSSLQVSWETLEEETRKRFIADRVP
jgi:hypothetical protein